MKTSICEILQIQYPIIQGGMAWVSDWELASAVSEAGGLGVIAAGNAPKDWVVDQIRKTKAATSKPFGVNIMLLSPYAEEITDAVVEEGVSVVITGAGNPGKYMEKWEAAGIKVVPVVPSVALAKRMARLGAVALVAEGGEAGGHIGELNTMALIPQVVDAVDIPVIAAGGIADQRGVLAALALGAEGVQIGTRFLVAKECTVHPDYKKKVIEAKDTDSQVTGRSTGHPVRILKNKLSRKFKDAENNHATPEELEKMGEGALYKAVKLGDIEMGSVMAGQVAGMVHKEQTCQEIIQEILSGLSETYKNLEAKVEA